MAAVDVTMKEQMQSFTAIHAPVWSSLLDRRLLTDHRGQNHTNCRSMNVVLTGNGANRKAALFGRTPSHTR
jgi:hypothetical protein